MLFRSRTLQVGINKLFPGFSAGLSSLSSWRRIFESGETKLQTHFLNLFFRIELPRGINLSFSMTDDNVRKQIASIQIFASKNIFRRLTATVSYFVAPNVPSTSIGFQLQYRFPFATTSTTVTRTEFGTSYGFLDRKSVV